MTLRLDEQDQEALKATAVLVEINRASVATAADDDVYDLVMAVASSKSSIDETANQLERLHEPQH